MNNTRGAGRTDIRVVRNSESKTETMSETPIEYFATCPKGFEQLLAEELKRLRAKRVRPLKSGVPSHAGRIGGTEAKPAFH